MQSKRDSKDFWDWIQKRQALFALVLAIISCICSIHVILAENVSARESGRLRLLIEREAEAAENKNVTQAISLFTSDADIYDAIAKKNWIGINAIRDRYLNLPQFDGLAHLDINIESVSLWDGTASASSTTVGQIRSNGITQAQTLFSKESWQFKKENGEWKISGFVINR